METKGPDAFTGIGNPDRDGVSTTGDDKQTTLGKLFYSVLSRVMDAANENSNSGA